MDAARDLRRADRHRVHLLQSTQLEYSQSRVFDLPPLESDTKNESLESYSRLDWTISSTNHFTGSALFAPSKTTYAGLTPFNPQPVTPDIKKHGLFGTASDQILVGTHGVLENTFSIKSFDVTIYPAVGHDPMVFAPEQNSGSYFNSTDGTSHRAEWLTTYTFAPFGSAHLIKLGGGARYETVGGVSTGAPVEIVREDRTLSSLTTFNGSGKVDLDRGVIKGFAQDTWTVSPRLTVVYGVRNDYDSFTGDVDVAPRGSFTASLTNDGRTMLRGGAGLFYTPLPLNVAVFDQLQSRTITQFDADGVTPVGITTLRNTTGADIQTPRSVNVTAELDREVVKNFFVRLSAQQRKTDFEPILDVSSSSIVLRTDGNSRYREGQVTARYQFHGQDQIVGSYTRSSAVGDLNDYNSFYGAIQNPIIRPNQRGPLPWDAPNRWLFWSNLSLPRQITVFPALDVRTGFPVLDRRRGPQLRRGEEPGGAVSDLRVSRRASDQAVPLQEAPDDGRDQGLQHDQSRQPTQLPEQPGSQRLRSLLQQRWSHVPRQVHLRVLRHSHDHTTNRGGAEAPNRILGFADRSDRPRVCRAAARGGVRQRRLSRRRPRHRSTKG